jgi:hypothetical protein
LLSLTPLFKKLSSSNISSESLSILSDSLDKTLYNKLIILSWSEPRTSLDAILDTEVIKYLFFQNKERYYAQGCWLRKYGNHTSNASRTHGS